MPTRIQIVGYGTPLPGIVVQSQYDYARLTESGAVVMPCDNTVPQVGEGNEFFSIAITPTSKANLLHHTMTGFFASNSGNVDAVDLK